MNERSSPTWRNTFRRVKNSRRGLAIWSIACSVLEMKRSVSFPSPRTRGTKEDAADSWCSIRVESMKWRMRQRSVQLEGLAGGPKAPCAVLVRRRKGRQWYGKHRQTRRSTRLASETIWRWTNKKEMGGIALRPERGDGVARTSQGQVHARQEVNCFKSVKLMPTSAGSLG